jgi:hypothetical protein
VLSLVGGISCLAGILALVITRGSMGTRAIVIGVSLCILNFVVATYADWVMIPMIVATGMISLAWGYITIRQMLKQKNGV